MSRPALLGAALALLTAACAGPRGGPENLPATRGDPAAEARHADLAMAAAVAAADVEAFAGHVGRDGIFFGGRGAAAGRAAVALSWAPFFAPGGPRLTWAPDRALASSSGDLVFTFGGGTFTPPGGPPVPVRYLTAWWRDADGLLRVAFDGSDVPLPPLPPGVQARALRTLASADGELLAEGGLLLEGTREAGWFLRLSRRAGGGFEVVAEGGALRAGPP